MSLVTLLCLQTFGQRPQVIAELRKSELTVCVTEDALKGPGKCVDPTVWNRAKVRVTIRPAPERYVFFQVVDQHIKKDFREKVNSRGVLSGIVLSDFPSKALLWYLTFLRPYYGLLDREGLYPDRMFLHTENGRPMNADQVTSAIQKSAKCHLRRHNVIPDCNSLRHVFATLSWKVLLMKSNATLFIDF